MRFILLLLAFVLPLTGFAQTSSLFTQQPVSTTGSIGGAADFSFTIRVPGSGADLGVLAFKSGVSAGSRFLIVSSAISSVISSGGSYTQGAYTVRISNLTTADAGSYTFEVVVNGLRYSNTTTQAVTLTVTTAPVAAPQITTQPQNTTAQAFGDFQLTVVASGTGLSYQWFKNDSPISGARSASYGNNFLTASDSGVYHVVVSNGSGSVTSNRAVVVIQASGAPSIATQPAAANVANGQSATFSVALAQSVFSPTYQWLFNNAIIAGATSATYTVASASSANAGNYSVLVANSFGSVLSSAAALNIVAATAPVITSQPVATTQRAGQAVSLSVTATGTPTPQYQWRKDGVAIAGATAATLAIANAQMSDAGSYTVVVSNSAGSVTSAAAVLTITPPFINPARLINLSILTPLEAGETMTLGVVLGGAGTSGAKPLLVRAAGPSLTALGVGGAMADPRIDLYSGSTLTAANNDWAGTPDLVTAFSSVGAFPFSAATSRDAAIYSPGLAAGGYTMQVRGVGVSDGTVLAELYDSTPAGTFTAATPRLINVSVLKTLQPGAVLTAGFVIGGVGTRTVLIRAVGPTLGQPPFGVAGVMADPKLTLYSGQTVVAANDNWGTQQNGTSTTGISTAADGVGAFRIADAGSRDAVLLVMLNPGNYTAQVTGVDSEAGGSVLVEVYEVP